MTRTIRLLSLAAIAALAVTACGGTAATSSPTAAATETPTETPASTATAVPSVEAPTVAPATSAPAAEGPDLSVAAEALEAIKKYQMSISVSGMAGMTGGEVEMSTLVDTDSDAYDLQIKGLEGLPAAESGLKVIVIGADAWVDLGTGAYIKQPGGSATYDQMRTALSPTTLLSQIPTTGFGALPAVDEEKNGVATKHYTAASATTPGLSGMLGNDGKMDIWVAADGGYLVSMVMSGTMDVGGTETPVNMSIDLSRINDESISIVAPN